MVAAILLAVSLVSTATAAPPFDPARIISDGVFYNSGSMSADAIQTFIRSKNPGCVAGYTCLYDYRESTFSRAADAQCGAYGGAGNERASDIVFKVARTCGVNPQVLLVLLQKESSLVGSTHPTGASYRTATGYGCPDTAPCDTQFYGFYNQVYKAAWAFKRYASTAATRNFQAGKTSQISYHPSASCGSSAVTIANQATAGLYTYTPYQPNAALLAGQPDACSSYGNLNFYRIFSEWFGSTSYTLIQPFVIWYNTAANAAQVGDPVADGENVAGGASQRFARGTIFYSGASGVWSTVGFVDMFYPGAGGPGGPLGFPVGNAAGIADGLSQDFQNGSLFVGPRGTWGPVTGWMRQAYLGVGGGPASIGFPRASQTTVAGGLAQTFERGSIYISGRTGAHPVGGRIDPAYVAAGGPAGALGFPVAEEASWQGGTRQAFEHGTITVTAQGSVAVTTSS